MEGHLNSSDENWEAVLDNTYEAVCAYARTECAALVRKVIYRLQRVAATDIYGDDYIYKTLWDEYCHEVQEGPHDFLEDAWEQSISTWIDEVIDRIPQHQAVLLSVFAARELDEGDDPNIVGSYWPDGIRQLLEGKLAEEAGCRGLDHLGPWREC